ncbi:MAG: Eco57I restriction-modification methylase domain-containing protein [Candidatus Aminicenantes bacterium]|nr:Eco57I restriction-modification methylase domain-containing protein [Candidatus Aminicenantes bacterium]
MDKNRERLEGLIGLFENNIRQYMGGGYDEAKARVDFIDKFFALLGWDIANEQGHSEQYREVTREDRLEISGRIKAPDYCFRVGGVRKFFVEAKKPSVDVKNDLAAAFQLRRYAYTAKLPLSILTDFEELAIYDTRIKPDQRDSSSVGRVFYCGYKDYLKNWDFIFDTFSKEAIWKGSFDRYVEENKRKKGTSEVDKEFLKLIEKWRETIAKSIALRNPDLSIYELNDSVQKTIDRIIFLRIAEDRDMEKYGRLQTILENKKEIYPQLVSLFAQADAKYNSGIFDFKTDQLTPKLKIDDKVFREIIKDLYYPESPYEFSVLPVEILGNIYEQFLGKTIHLTAGHQARVEEKPEVRKAGGVYYTPKYIVDYIVKNTIGELLKNRDSVKKGDIAEVAIPQIKTLDPACGSGSFLIAAYQCMLDAYLEYYSGLKGKGTARPTPMVERDEKILRRSLKENRIYLVKQNEYRLTIGEKQRILQKHIYGVDIDRQAVEVTKLSLLLKLLEGENRESTGYLFKYSDIKLLPNLSDNIKCGNSLIGSDFYDSLQKDLFSDEEVTRRLNVFDWEKEFPEVFENGGFDAVIGNPPYVRQEGLGEYKEYLSAHYRVYHGVADLYAYFIEKGMGLLKKNSLFGIIVANKWMRAGYGEPLRRFLKSKEILEIIDFGDLPVFEKATTYPCILLVKNHDREDIGRDRSRPVPTIDAVNMKTLLFGDLSAYVEANKFKIDVEQLDDAGWALAGADAQALLQKLKTMVESRCAVTLGEYVDGKIYYGIKTGLNEAFVIDESTKKRLIKEDLKSKEIIKPFLAGRDIKRYQQPVSDKYLIFTRHGIDIKKYPAIENYLLPFKDRLMPKPNNYKGKEWKGRKPGAYHWYEIQDTIDYFKEFEKPKIMWPEIAGDARFAYDTLNLYANNKTYLIAKPDLYLLGLLNSSLIRFFIHSVCTDLQGSSFNFSAIFVDRSPIRTINFSSKEDKKTHDCMIEIVETMLDLQKKYHDSRLESERSIYKKQIAILDQKIDCLVYELYGITEAEIKIVEER